MPILKNIPKEIDNLTQSMDNKVSTQDISKIWKHFDRFALYDDLK